MAMILGMLIDLKDVRSQPLELQISISAANSSSKQTWMPFGPQRNVEEDIVSRGGWRECYRKGYENALSDSDVTNIETNKCRGRNIMLSCRKKSSTHLKVHNLGLMLYSFLTFCS